ncbi:MAG TPA: ATP-binding cassette domain-containing protein [Nitrospirota bacterium]|nr:ATP-binding cassette domain-containing protein [Nitrospirota bacterium]
MIEFRDVTLSYNENPVLDGMSFSIQFHEKIAILGSSGKGKTTILKLILGLEQPDSGKILINRTDIANLSESKLRDIRMNFSVVFQEGALFDSLSVRDNVSFCLLEREKLPEDIVESTVKNLLDRVGIKDAADLMPEELSGGMQRRVAIARSLAGCKPKMMLYDEPTSGLDPITADTICDLINELSSGNPSERTGLIIVTHDVADAVKVADRFLYLRNGKIRFDGDLGALTSTQDAELKRFIKDIL